MKRQQNWCLWEIGQQSTDYGRVLPFSSNFSSTLDTATICLVVLHYYLLFYLSKSLVPATSFLSLSILRFKATAINYNIRHKVSTLFQVAQCRTEHTTHNNWTHTEVICGALDVGQYDLTNHCQGGTWLLIDQIPNLC